MEDSFPSKGSTSVLVALSSVVENIRVVAVVATLLRIRAWWWFTNLEEKAVDNLMVDDAIVMAKVAAAAIVRFILVR